MQFIQSQEKLFSRVNLQITTQTPILMKKWVFVNSAPHEATQILSYNIKHIAYEMPESKSFNYCYYE